MNKIITNSEKETKNLAKNLAKQIKGGQTIALNGDLGAGKTMFVKGLAESFGIKNVSSPTFVLMKVYNIKNNKNIDKLCHIDAYRLIDYRDLLAIGADEYIKDKKTLVVIEWADKVKKILPNCFKAINIKHLEQNVREFSLNF